MWANRVIMVISLLSMNFKIRCHLLHNSCMPGFELSLEWLCTCYWMCTHFLISSWWFISHYEISLFISMLPSFKFSFSEITLNVLLPVFAIFFHLITHSISIFIINMSFISIKSLGFYFIYYDNVCLLFEVFNPFTNNH